MSVSFREPIRVGIVGLGRAGLGMHCPELASLPEIYRITAVCDPLKDRRDQAVAKYGCRAYRRYEDLLADSEVELIDIATRSDDHLPHAVAALKTRKWVNLEKPMCLSYEEALVLRAAAIKAGNRLFVRHNRRYEPNFQHVRELIHSGMLGEVYDIKLRRGGFQRRDDWQTVKRCGGGQLLNWGPHIIDHALQFLDAPPVRIFSDLKRVAAMGDAEDYVRIVMRNAAGLTVDLEISGGRVISEPECLVTGSKGALSVSGSTVKLRYLDPKQKLSRRRASVRTPPLTGFGSPDTLKWVEESIPVAPKTPSSMTMIWEHLAAAIRLNKSYPVALDEAVDVMRIISLARKDTPFA
jgi:scyllo-inositol 2-dehydrogenase (NADP+)